MNKKFLIIFLAAMIIRFIFLDTSYVFWDEGVYISNAKFIAGDSNYNELSLRPPLVSFVLGLFYKIFGYSEILSRIIMILINSIFIFLIYKIGSEINEKTGLLCAFFAGFMPFLIETSQWIMADSINMLMITLCIYFCIKAKKNLHFLVLGIVFSLTILTKWSSFLILLILLPSILIKVLNLKRSLFVFLGLLIPFLPYILFYYLNFGDVFNLIVLASDILLKKDPASVSLILWSIFDLSGLLIMIGIFGVYFSIKKKKDIYFVYWFVSLLILYVIFLNKGVDKPPDILWMVERVGLPFIPPLILISSIFLEKLNKKYIIPLLFLFVLINVPQYLRYYEKAINYEGGLRKITKQAGFYLNENINKDATVYCSFNCPSIAVYTNQEIKVFSKLDDLKPKTNDVIVIFQNTTHEGYSLLKKFTSNSWELFVFKKT